MLWDIGRARNMYALWRGNNMKYFKNLDKVRGIVPNFNDSNAVIREYTDNTGELQKIEIFYGGKHGGDSEGHGHWVAENIEGLFQVTLDRNPDSIDGGKHFIESNHRTDAYNEEARHERIRNKLAVISELKNIDVSANFSLGEKVKELRDKFYNCGSCGYEDNKRLKEEFEATVKQLFDERERTRQEYKRKKENIIRQAENLMYTTDLKMAKDQMKALQEEWKRIPRLSKEDESELWMQFKKLIDKLYENIKQNFENQKRKQEEAKNKKQDLIKEAEKLVYSTDFKIAKGQAKDLQEKWRQIPRAAKADEEVLWSQFKKAIDRLYENAQKDFEKRKLQQVEAKNRKEGIIFQIENMVHSDDYKSAALEVKRLSDEFFHSGSAGKDNQRLVERLNSVKSQFFAAKKSASEQKRQEFLRKLQEIIYRKKEALSRLDTSIYNKEEQLSDLLLRPDPSPNNPHRWDIAARRNEKASRIRSSIVDMKIKKEAIINEIVELEGKLRN